MNVDSLTPEQMEKAKACQNPAELFALAREEGVELTDEQLGQVAAGIGWLFGAGQAYGSEGGSGNGEDDPLMTLDPTIVCPCCGKSGNVYARDTLHHCKSCDGRF